MPAACGGCGAPLAAEASLRVVGRHQVWEIPAPRAVVSEYRLHRSRCDCCGCETTASLPAGVPAGMFGPNLEAAIVGLTLSERVSRRRVCEVIDELCGVSIGLGTIDRVLARAANAFAPALAAIDESLAGAASRCVDETSWQVAGQRVWAWAATSPQAVRFRIVNSRGRDSCHTLLGERPGGVMTTDRWSAYGHLPLAQRQICWAHLARDFRAVAEKPGRVGQIASRLVATTSRLFLCWRDQRADREALRAALGPVREALDDDLDQLARCGEDHGAAEFALNLIILGDALWTFAHNPAVEPTNNAVERALRPLVIHRKTSYGTQTEHGTRVYETLQSIVGTLRHQHRNVYAWLRDALDAAHHGHALPAIITT
jgi:transposase